MMSITWDQIEERAAAFHATHNVPKAAAIRAIYTPCSVLADLGDDDRAAVLDLLE